MSVTLITTNFKFRNRSTCSKVQVKRTGKVCGRFPRPEITWIERALGMLWNVENDTLEFKITLVNKLLTRRGILGTVSLIYDPLGLVSSLLLPGRHILQLICCERTDWDEPVSDEIRCAWEKWRQNLQVVDKIMFDQCYKPADFGDLSSARLHQYMLRGDLSSAQLHQYVTAKPAIYACSILKDVFIVH